MTDETITVMRGDSEIREMDSLESAFAFKGHKGDESKHDGLWIRVEGEYRTFRADLSVV